MKNPIARILSFTSRLNWASRLMGSHIIAASYLVKARNDLNTMGNARYKDMPFTFCGYDLSALKEVLIDNEYEFLTHLLEEKEAPIILDVGAHIGTFSLWCLGVNSNSHILSIEADPNTNKTLSENIKRNQEKTVRWSSLHSAAWKNNDLITFSSKGDSMSHRIDDNGSISVQGVTLKDLINTLGGKVDLMKVDIEGAEEAFICEMPELLSNVKNLVIELHPNLCDTDNVRGALAQIYPTIEEIEGRTSSKPLLFCRQ